MNPAFAFRFRPSRAARPTLRRGALLALSALGLLPPPAHAQPPAHAASSNVLMPVPASVRWDEGQLVVARGFSTEVRGADDGRVRDALTRMVQRWQERVGYDFAPSATPAPGATDARPARLVVNVTRLAPAIPQLGEEESYQLSIGANEVVLQAATTTGALRGVATLTELLQSDRDRWFLPAGRIEDAPRFGWRGLLIDVGRHWMPLDVIERNLDGMALVKLNVLHLHLTEDQGFRIESRRYPRLQQLGSDGHFFTQDQIRELVAYAAARGIRVVPEFDVPGHATSWAVAYPEFASAPGPYAIDRRWGVHDVVLDPSNEQLYAFLDGFFGEMAALFPDPYVHIGGDENNGRQWNANPRIREFIQSHGLKDNAGLHAYFNRRMRDILQKHGKKLVGWDEILHGDLPRDSVIQSWRGATGLGNAVSAGFPAILSNGFYIDLCLPAADHYRNDPVPAGTALTPDQQRLILGGEATMWSEWVDAGTIDSRIWPRTAAIAERLWSPREVNDVPDMYRRLAIVSRRLEEAGLDHERNRPPLLRRFAGDQAGPELLRSVEVLADAVEPVKNYQRGRLQKSVTQLTPLGGLADCARPESDCCRVFADAVNALLFGEPADAAAAKQAVGRQLAIWTAAANAIGGAVPGGDRRDAPGASDGGSLAPAAAAEAGPVAAQLADACAVGRDALARWAAAEPTAEDWRAPALERLDAAAKPHAAVELPMIRPLRLLAAAAAVKAERASLSPREWRERIEKLGGLPPTKAVH